MSKKKFLIDTSVIIDNPSQNLGTLYQNGDNEIYITEIVLAELDKHKTSVNSEVHVPARSFFRAVGENELIETNSLKNDKNDKFFTVELKFEDMTGTILLNVINRPRKSYVSSYKDPNDAKIQEVAATYSSSHDMVFITNDMSFRLLAQSEGIKAKTLKFNSVNSPEKITFDHSIEISEKTDLQDFLTTISGKYPKYNQVSLSENGRKRFYLSNGNSLLSVRGEKEEYTELNVKPINIEQKFYAELLQLPFKIMAVTGSTGSGKTLLAVQEGIRRVNDPDSKIDGVIYMRYTVNTNDKHAELGFRAGDESQKLNYFNYPLYSALNFILEQSAKNSKRVKDQEDSSKDGINKSEKTEEFMKENNIVVTDIAHARGITLANKFVIFDEVQNAPNSILQLIGTRIGNNAPIVLMGDFRQVDHPYLNKTRNALVTLLRLAEKDSMVAAIQLKTTVRSEVAEWFQENVK